MSVPPHLASRTTASAEGILRPGSDASPAPLSRWFAGLWLTQLLIPATSMAFVAAYWHVLDALGWFLLDIALLWMAAAVYAIASARGRRWLAARQKRIALGYGSAVFTLCAADAVLTLTGRVPSMASVRRHAFLYEPAVFTSCRMVPNHTHVDWDEAPWKTIHVNSLGLRGPEIRVEKQPGVVRILFLGGSQVFGIHGPDWPRLAGSALAERGWNVEVINAGVPSYKSADTLGQLLTWLWMLKPDVVVLSNEWNDIKYFERLDPHHPYYDIVKPYSTGWMLEPQGMDGLLSVSAFYRFARLRLLRKLSTDEGEAPRSDTGRVGEWGIRQYTLNLRTLCDLAKNIGASVVLCKPGRLPVSDLESGGQEKLRPGYIGLSYGEILRAFVMCDQAVDAVAAEKRGFVIDVNSALSGHPEYFDDEIHYNRAGSARAAAVVAEGLEKFLSASPYRDRKNGR